MAELQWKQGNTTKYLRIPNGSKEDISVDLFAELATGDSLSDCVFTTTANITITETAVYTDQIAGKSTPHIAQAFFKPNETGTHGIKMVANTVNNKKIVYHFDILTEEL
jgi:hypothetical protein|tara:strand:+ start:1646 stop:1972 length:327 start_codon:yes stop_codon:yes gene_type:complete